MSKCQHYTKSSVPVCDLAANATEVATQTPMDTSQRVLQAQYSVWQKTKSEIIISRFLFLTKSMNSRSAVGRSIQHLKQLVLATLDDHELDDGIDDHAARQCHCEGQQRRLDVQQHGRRFAHHQHHRTVRHVDDGA